MTFLSAREDERLAVEAFTALAAHLDERAERDTTLREIDGQSVRGSRWEALLRESGFAPDYRGMVLAPKVAPKPKPKGYTPPAFSTPNAPAREGLTGFIPPTFSPAPDPDGFVPPTSFTPTDEEPPKDPFARRFFFKRKR